MNLVIDDAVEVKLKTKEEEESRRELGQFFFFFCLSFLFFSFVIPGDLKLMMVMMGMVWGEFRADITQRG